MPHTYLTNVQEQFFYKMEHSNGNGESLEESALNYYLSLGNQDREELRKIDKIEVYIKNLENKTSDAERFLWYKRRFLGVVRFAVRVAFNGSTHGSALEIITYKSLFPKIWATIPENERARYLNQSELEILEMLEKQKKEKENV